MKITISQILDRDVPDDFEDDLYPVQGKIWGECNFEQSETEGSLVINNTVTVSNGKVLTVDACYEQSSGNMNIFIKEDGVHVFTAGFNWTVTTPYLAFCLSDGVFTELYFKK